MVGAVSKRNVFLYRERKSDLYIGTEYLLCTSCRAIYGIKHIILRDALDTTIRAIIVVIACLLHEPKFHVCSIQTQTREDSKPYRSFPITWLTR